MKEATIQRIKTLEPIENADFIEKATFKNISWQCVVKKGDFQIGDLCVYIQIDSIVPELPTTEFLRKDKFRVRTIKLKGTLSQGLALPLVYFPLVSADLGDIGTDVSELLGVIHYEKPLPANSGDNKPKGNFPTHLISKTDEIRIQNEPELIQKLWGTKYYITEKADGTSATYYKYEGKFGVCSRNLELYETETSIYWRMARKYDLENIIPDNFAIQGEIVGVGINKNPMCFIDNRLLVFNLLSIPQQLFFDYWSFEPFTKQNNLETVKLIEKGDNFQYTLEQLLEIARGKYEGTNNFREGIVVRSWDKSISFKVMNNEYLLKNKE